MSEAREAFELVIIDAPREGEAGPVDVRLRRALKALSRAWGFRCLWVRSAGILDPDAGPLGLVRLAWPRLSAAEREAFLEEVSP